MSKNLTSKTVSGFQWTLYATVLHIFLQLFYTSIIAQKVSKESFGVVALAMVILHFGSYFAQLGMAQSIIQKSDLENTDIRAAFTANLVLGTLFVAIFQIIAPFSVYLLKDAPPEIVSVIRVMSLAVFIECISATSIGLIRRRMLFKSLAYRNIISYVLAYICIGLGFAWAGFGVWALVFASLSQLIINGMLAFAIARHSLKPTFVKAHFKSILGYGSKVSVNGFLEFMIANLDTLMISKFVGSKNLGVYNRAAFLINVPVTRITKGVAQVMFPSLSKIKDDLPRLSRVYISSINLLWFILLPVCVGLSAAASPIVLSILGHKWSDAIPILQILALSTPFRLTSHFGGVLCDATANLRPKFYLLISYIIILSTLFLAFSGYGLQGFATALLLGNIAKNISYTLITKRILSYSWADVIQGYIPAIFTASVVWGLIYLTVLAGEVLHLLPFVILLGTMGAGALGLLVSFILPPNRHTRHQFADRVEKLFKKKNKNNAKKSRKIEKILNFLKK